MDEKKFDLNTGDSLPDGDEVYRIALVTDRDRKNKNIPAIRCFSLSPQDDSKLSVDWSRKTTPEECVARVGASYKFKSAKFKPYENREIYALTVKFLRSLDDIEEVSYDPITCDSSEKRRVNNPAHSLVIFSKTFAQEQARVPEALVKIRDHAKNKRVEFKMERVHQLVADYRDQL